MTYRFDPSESFIAVEAVLIGPTAIDRVILALDTGATQTAIDNDVLAFIGLDSVQPITQFSVVTVNGQVLVEEFRLDSLAALGLDRRRFDVIAMTVEKGGYAGMLGKDFFIGKVLTIDFRIGTIELQ